MKLSVADRTGTEVGAYAARELERLLGEACGAHFAVRGAELAFVIETDERLPEYAWRVRKKGRVVHLSGRTEREALLAVYELLGELGFFFGVETLYPARVDFSVLENLDRTVRPFVRLRGVRQHINFPMDISAYPLDEAEEYIRSLARMRMNAITFHSYDGMWHRGAGHLFYGQGYPLSSAGRFRPFIHNREMFFPPEGEGYLRDEEKLDCFAVERLRRLIDVAKEAGLHVTVSMELRHGSDVEDMIAATRELLVNYPRMDCLEWISPEGGGEGPEMTAENAAEVVRGLFGDAALGKDGSVTGLGSHIPDQLPGALDSVARALAVYRRRDEVFRGLKEIPIRTGLYITDGESLRVTKAIMDRVLPDGLARVYLPGHGAEYQCSLIRKMRFCPGDWQNTVLHSWAEFDGNMYLYQNCATGLEHLMTLVGEQSGANSVYAMYVNHWRTAENAVSLAYIGAAMVHPLPSAEFYRDYASAYGIPAVPFAAAMDRLGILDIYNRDHIFNIGFCYLNCWLSPRGITWLDGMEERGIRHAIGEFSRIADVLETLLDRVSDRAGIAVLRLLVNRCRASAAHIRGVSTLKEIGALLGTSVPGKLTPEQLTAAEALCDRAKAYFDEYASIHSTRMPDRGCEGTLISYLCTMPVYVEHVRRCVLGHVKLCTHRAPKAAIIAPV